MMDLKGKTIIVTGAASGIGRAISVKFADAGATVLVSDIREAPIGSMQDEDGETSTEELIRRRGGTATFVKADVTKWADVDALISRAVEDHGRLDVIVNNAAVFNAKSILETTEEEFDQVINVNVRAQFLCCKRAIQQMLGQEPRKEVRGRIINVTSQHGMVGPPNFFAYGVSKGGMLQATRQLAVDYGRQGIIVNSVAPGRILTGTHPGEADYSDPGLEYSQSRTPFSRLGRAEDVAGAALYLASDECTYVSGHHLLVDGGWMAY
jgi:glucose 1-dehydrogenase